MSSQQTRTVTLVVDNFSQLTTYKHEKFSFVGSNCYFGVYPKIYVPSVSTDNVYVFWHGFDETRTNVHFKVSILNANSEKLYTQEYNWELESSYLGNRPFISFISRAKLMGPKNGYLVNDKLTLLCEAETLDQKPNAVASTLQDWKNLSEDFQSLLIHGKFSDATLIVGSDGKIFHVHKNILAARSAVFAAMFEHDCEEKRQNEVKIIDIDHETCEELLVYIVYTGKVKQMDRYALDLLQAADKYQLESLKNMAEDFLCSTISVETAANVLFVADLHGAIKLKDKCLEYIWENMNQVKDADGWKILDTNAKLLKDLLFYSTNKNK